MQKRMSRGALAAAVFTALLAPAAAHAQPADERIRQLERKIDALLREASALRAELDELKEEPAPAVAEAEDLTAVQPLEGSTSATPGPVLEAEIIANQPPPSRTAFNPEISVIGNVLGHLGDENPFEERDPLALEEAEISLQAFVDPYARAAFFIGVGEEGAELEEGYIQFLTLPLDLTARAGKLKAGFGKFNTQHAHTWLWADQPLVSRSFFGEEGLADSGISVSRLVPNRWDLFVEATAEVYRGSVEELFEPEESSDLLYVGHLKTFRDLSDATNVELGGSFAQGTASEGVASRFAGVDFTYRWKPLQRAMYESFISRTEIMANDRDDQDDAAIGFYTAADYQFARRWSAGLRLDQADRPEAPFLTDRGGALTLTFRPSEFSQIRGELRRTSYDGADDATEVLFQIQFGIGAHGAHSF